MKRKQELRAYRLAELMESRTARPGELWAILTGQLDRHAGLDRITPRTKIACKDCGVDLAGAERVSYDTVRCAPCARTLNRERVRRHRNTGKEPSR